MTHAPLNPLDGRTAAERIAWAAQRFPGALVAASSFGADSAVLLHLLAEAAPEVPVVFVDTGFHFDETLEFKDRLASLLGLTVREVSPVVAREDFLDRHGAAYEEAPGFCCDRNLVQPLRRALAGASCWISGARRDRQPLAGRKARAVPVLDPGESTILRLNPLADWDQGQVDAYLRKHNLPRHPLAAEGYTRVGCWPCSVKPAVDLRTGLLPGSAARRIAPPAAAPAWSVAPLGAPRARSGTERHVG